MFRLSLLAWGLAAVAAWAQVPSFAPLDPALLDPAAFRQWAEGKESEVDLTEATKDSPGGVFNVVWTTKGKVAGRGVEFGDVKSAGARYLRVGFTQAVPVGSVLVRGGGALSVLKAGAAYPGDLADDAQWVAAERIVDGAVSAKEAGRDGYALWVLPAGTSTRALRFTHVPSPGDKTMAGLLGGAWVLPERLVNVAPQALAQSTARDDASAKLVDESNNGGWGTWSNGQEGAALVVSPEHPEVFTLTWEKAVKLAGVAFLWTGFDLVEVEAFRGKATEPIAEAGAASWQKVATSGKLADFYTAPLGPNWLGFAQTVETRALRFRIVKANSSNHPHLVGKRAEGKRVWLGEVLALAPLPQGALASLIIPKAAEEPPPIPVKFTLAQPGVVTLVIEDAQGKRVRNLVSETPFPAGENIAWWDGSDDLSRDVEAAKHGLYHIPAHPVEPGTYTVRGLVHSPVELHYEMSIYNAGKPAWKTEDNTGGWMTTHTPPTSVAVVPGSQFADGQPVVFLGAYVAEGGHGLQWLHEDGQKFGGQGWVGGTWTGAPTLAVDTGVKAIAEHACYVGSIWEGELRLTAKTRELKDEAIFKELLGDDPKKKKLAEELKPPVLEGFDGGGNNFVLAGLAARDGVVVCSMIRQNELLWIDVKTRKVTGRLAVENPRGVAFDAQGDLLVLSEKQLLRFPPLPWTKTPSPEVVIKSGLEDPRHVALDAKGNFFVSDRGQSHQVKVFSPAGQPLKPIGLAGVPATGPYEPRRMHNPNGFALDSQGRLWVAEADNSPRRVSIWKASGELERAFYGPTEYGGGGALDPRDSARFYYKGLEFALDWKAGTDRLVRVFAKPSKFLRAHGGHHMPDTPLYPEARPGERYFTSCYTQSPTSGVSAAFLWRDTPGEAKLVAGLGDARRWDWLEEPEQEALWPAELRGDEKAKKKPDAMFFWNDADGNGEPSFAEVKLYPGKISGVTVMNDLGFIVNRFDEKTARFLPVSFSAQGVPAYDLTKPELLGPAGGSPPSSGGNQALVEPGGWTINTNAPAPFSAYGLGGSFKGEARWSYPSPWPGLHASHEAAVPDRPGQVMGHTRLLGGWVTPKGESGPLFCINGNMGNMYLFTADGLFVSTLFHDIRTRPVWGAPLAVRDMDVTNVSLHDENFWPSISQVPDGRIFLVDGGRTSLVRVDGLDGTKRIAPSKITVTAADLQKSRDWLTRTESARQQQRGSGLLTVTRREQPPVVDGKVDDWPATTDWATIDRRGTKANFNSKSQPYDVSAAVAISGDRLYAAWRSNEKDLLANSGETANALFKTGGALDLMLGANPAAPADRKSPSPGDQRLLVSMVGKKPRALLYRAKVPGTKDPVAFSSPWRTLTIDQVEDVTAQIQFAANGEGDFELSLPLALLKWQPQPGQTYRADLGVLRGDKGQTTQRVYWANKATAITADVPSEAELLPALWGKWVVK